MKFYKQLERNMVQEWVEKYVDYKELKHQINAISDKSLRLAQAISDITEITNEVVLKSTIDIKKMKDNEKFWEILENNVIQVEMFYKEQEKQMLDHFHALAKRAVKMGLLSKFNPYDTKFASRLERELSRLKTVATVSLLKDDDSPNLLPKDRKDYPLHQIETVNEFVQRDLEHESLLQSKSIQVEVVEPVEQNNIKSKIIGVISKSDLRQSFREFYRGLMLLEGYCNLNYEAIGKILKKYDKTFGTTKKSKYMPKVESKTFYRHKNLKLLIGETEHLFSQAFTNGHRTQAMEKLRIPRKKKVGSSLFRLGVNVGLSCPIFALIMYLIFSKDPASYPMFYSVFIVYRMLAMAVLMVWFWGLDLLVWTKFRVNYVFIFEFNPREHIRFQNMLEAASLFTLVWVCSLALYVISICQPVGFEWLARIPFILHPLALVLITAVAFMVFQVKGNFWLLRTLARIVCAPFVSPVIFRDFFVADQLVSLSIVLYDMEYILCFFVHDAWNGKDACEVNNVWTRPLIAVMPAMWRFLQCLRRYYDTKDKAHLLNAGKYSSSFLVVLFSALRNVQGFQGVFLSFWLVSVIFSTCFSSYWDIYRDWGLGDPQYGYLRKTLLYGQPVIYYIAIGVNIFLRLMWTLTISPQSLGIVMNPLGFAALLASIEIARRGIWNLFRLENEQLNNVGKFRTVNIVVPPSDQDSLNNETLQKLRNMRSPRPLHERKKTDLTNSKPSIRDSLQASKEKPLTRAASRTSMKSSSKEDLRPSRSQLLRSRPATPAQETIRVDIELTDITKSERTICE